MNDLSTLAAGFGFILIAAVAGGAFGLQYRVMRRYSVENSSLLSLFFATIVVPLVAVWFILPGWTSAIREVGWERNLLVFAFGFGWGMGCITYAYGFNILGMALAASLLKGIAVAVGAGVPLVRRWHEVPENAKLVTIAGLTVLLAGTAHGRPSGDPAGAGVARPARRSARPASPRPGRRPAPCSSLACAVASCRACSAPARTWAMITPTRWKKRWAPTCSGGPR